MLETHNITTSQFVPTHPTHKHGMQDFALHGNPLPHADDSMVSFSLSAADAKELDELFAKLEKLAPPVELSARDQKEVEDIFKQLDELFEKTDLSAEDEKRVDQLFSRLDKLMPAEPKLSAEDQKKFDEINAKIDAILSKAEGNAKFQQGPHIDPLIEQLHTLGESQTLSGFQVEQIGGTFNELNQLLTGALEGDDKKLADNLFRRLDQVLTKSADSQAPDKQAVAQIQMRIDEIFAAASDEAHTYTFG